MIGKEKSTQDPGSKNRNPGHPPHYCGLAQQLRPGFRSIPGPPARLVAAERREKDRITLTKLFRCLAGLRITKDDGRFVAAGLIARKS